MPKLGVDMQEGEIIEWKKQEGDVVNEGDILLEIMSDKTNMELEAEDSGVLLKITRQAGETVPVTEVIGYIGAEGEVVADNAASAPVAEATVQLESAGLEVPKAPAQAAPAATAEKAPLVIVKGMAGTSKTFYSLAVGLEKLMNHPTGEYRKILVCRPNAQFDEGIGFLPGDEQEKISPLMRPVLDNLEQLLDSNEDERYKDEEVLRDKVEEIYSRGFIQAEALNFIRGRSIVKTYLIIDEAQNTTPDQIKGIITRAGKDTKIILLGDPNQIDRPFLDERTNGLSYAAEHMKGSPLCWQLTMTAEECERSELAMEAVKRL